VTQVSFYFDLGSPYAYLAAERLGSLQPGPVEWRPVLLGGIFKQTGRSSWARADESRREEGIAEIERRCADYGLPPIVWPDGWPSDYLTAMRAATFAFSVGVGHEFTRQAFRDAFQRGSDLSRLENVLEAGRQVGIDPAELQAAAAEDEIKRALRAETDRAVEAGVTGVPTIAVEGELFWGDDRLADAAAHLRAVTAG
jgi:2-hydroxychromene-2-carboxylate isomerase